MQSLHNKKKYAKNKKPNLKAMIFYCAGPQNFFLTVPGPRV